MERPRFIRASLERLNIYAETLFRDPSEVILELNSEINSYYSSQSWHKSIFLNLGVVRPPTRIEACKGALSYLESRTNTPE